MSVLHFDRANKSFHNISFYFHFFSTTGLSSKRHLLLSPRLIGSLWRSHTHFFHHLWISSQDTSILQLGTTPPVSSAEQIALFFTRDPLHQTEEDLMSCWPEWTCQYDFQALIRIFLSPFVSLRLWSFLNSSAAVITMVCSFVLSKMKRCDC